MNPLPKQLLYCGPIVVVVALSFGAATAFGAPTDHSAESVCSKRIPGDPVDNRLLKAVFKVSKTKGGDRNPWTATLIDNRGYFISASHVTHTNPHRKEVETWQTPYDGPLFLSAQQSDGLELTAREIGHGNYKTGYDFSLIQAELPEGKAALSLPAIDPLIIVPQLNQETSFMGYPGQSATPHMKATRDYQVTMDDEGWLAFVGSAYGGQSGTLLLGQYGKAVGVLHGKTEKLLGTETSTTHVQFAMLFKARPLLAKIPPSPRAKALIDHLKTAQNEMPILSKDFRQLDVVAVRNALENRRGEFEKTLGRYSFDLGAQLMELGLCADAAWIIANFQPQVSLYELAQAGQMFLRTAVASSAASERRELAELSATILGDSRDGSASGASLQAKAYAFWLNYDLARARYLSGIGDEASQKVTVAAITKAIELNPLSHSAYELASKIFQQSGKWDLAAAAWATAFSVSPETEKERLTRDWRFLTSMNSQLAPSGPTVKDPLPSVGSDIVKAPVLTMQDFGAISREWGKSPRKW